MDLTDERTRLLRTDPVVVGARIRAARIAAGLTQGALGEGLVSTSHVSRVESGRRRADARLIGVISTRLAVSIDALLDDAPASEPRPALQFAEIAADLGDASVALAHLAAVDESALDAADQWRAGLVRARALEGTGDLAGAVEALERLRPRAVDAHQHARLGIALSRCHRELGACDEAVRVGEAALATARDLGLPPGDDSVQLSVTIAAAYFEGGQHDCAVRVCRRAVAVADEVGSPGARSAAYWTASNMMMEQGDAEGAVPAALAALELMRDAPDRRNLGPLLTQVGLLHLRLDPPDVRTSRSHLVAATTEMRMSHVNRPVRLRAELGLAHCDLLDGEVESALLRLTPLLEQIHGLTPVLQADAVMLAAQVDLARGEVDDARTHLDDAARRLSPEGRTRPSALRWLELAMLFDAVGDGGAAKDAYVAAATASGTRSSLVGRPPVPVDA